MGIISDNESTEKLYWGWVRKFEERCRPNHSKKDYNQKKVVAWVEDPKIQSKETKSIKL